MPHLKAVPDIALGKGFKRNGASLTSRNFDLSGPTQNHPHHC